MNFEWTSEHEQIRDAIERVCVPFDANYWLHKDREGDFPHDFHQALADSGWLGIAMPEEFGGAGLGISEAALMMHTISAAGAGLSGASAVHEHLWLTPSGSLWVGRPEGTMASTLIAGKERLASA